jgi:hypothetical protein
MTRLTVWIKAANEVKLLGRKKVLLAFDDNKVVRVDCVPELLKSLLVEIVQVGSGDYRSKLWACGRLGFQDGV